MQVIWIMSYNRLFVFCIAAFAFAALCLAGSMFLVAQGGGAGTAPFTLVALCWTGMAVLAGWTALVCKGHAQRIEQLERRLQEVGSAPLR
jgi:membrane protein implicated in regulation of membrane protease activity